MRRIVFAGISLVAVSLVCTIAFRPMSAIATGTPGSGRVRGAPSDAQHPAPPRDGSAHSFYFTRAVYSGGGWRRRGSWATDYPAADIHFLVVLRRVTNMDAYEAENPIRLDDPEIRRFPFLYAVEVGHMGLTDAEVAGLRDYLLAGGFLMVDDFWGTREWMVFEANMRRVFPDREIVEIPPDHPVFRSYYRIDELVQVPGIRVIYTGQTWEQDGYDPHLRGIFDDDGRLLVAVNWNTDMGDAWEHADVAAYPLDRSTFAYEMAVNLIVYAMSH